MKLIFVRHGDPDYPNDSLTERGFKEAEILKERIKEIPAKEYYCSPLGRAQRTAEPSLKLLNKTAVTLDWLREFPGKIIDPRNGKPHFPWDFLPSYWTKQPDLYDRDKWIDTEIINTGDAPEVYRYVIREFDNFLKEHGYEREGGYYKAVKPNKDAIVFFCHFGIEAVLISHLIGVSPLVLWQGFVAPPTSVTTVQTEEREEGIAYFRCRGFGDVSHLYLAGQQPSNSAAFCEVFTDKDERH